MVRLTWFTALKKRRKKKKNLPALPQKGRGYALGEKRLWREARDGVAEHITSGQIIFQILGEKEKENMTIKRSNKQNVLL